MVLGSHIHPSTHLSAVLVRFELRVSDPASPPFNLIGEYIFRLSKGKSVQRGRWSSLVKIPP
jgi:hypothetical protein